MSTVVAKTGLFGKDMFSFLDKEHSIAKPGYNRWFVPPAALAIHLCIGMAYAFSVFWLPLSTVKGVQCTSAVEEIFTNKCDWQISTLVYTYSLFFFFLGFSSALMGKWLESAGPRKAGVVSAILWPLGLVLGAIAISVHSVLFLWIGCGCIGGFGLGIGYISPVSTLIKWFPDKRGLATGMAIMGFGGGAIIGAPLAVKLMGVYSNLPIYGIPATIFTLAAVFFPLMMSGAMAYRVPPPDFDPATWGTGRAKEGDALPTLKTQSSSYYSFKTLLAKGHTHVDIVHKTPQFALMWVMVFCNVMAGVGLVGVASVMLQEIFGGQLIGKPDLKYTELTKADKKQTALVGAGFVGFISIFNIMGRFGWGVVSDYIGRKNTFSIFFTVGAILYSIVPTLGTAKNLPGFTAAICMVVSFYGGNFAALPAYIADLWGTTFVGAIHGRTLTTWMIGGIVGPQIQTYMRAGELKKGVPLEHAYDTCMYVLAGFLALGQICNFFVTPVDEKYFMSEQELAEVRAKLFKTKPVESIEESKNEGATAIDIKGATVKEKGFKSVFAHYAEPVALVLAWASVSVPFCWGLYQTILKSLYLFGKTH